jgi:hypothetical protein
VRDGLKNAWTQRVRATAEKVLSSELGRLSSDELMDGAALAARVEATLVELRARLAPLHVEAEAVLVQGVFFASPYETKLQEKQLTRQQASQLDVAVLVEDRKKDLGLLEQEIEREVGLETARAEKRKEELRLEHQARLARRAAEREAYVKRRKVEAETEVEKMLAAGRLAVAEAEAERERLVHAVYATPGGRAWLARQAAENLRLRRVALDPDDARIPSMLDLDAMVRLLLGEE